MTWPKSSSSPWNTTRSDRLGLVVGQQLSAGHELGRLEFGDPHPDGRDRRVDRCVDGLGNGGQKGSLLFVGPALGHVDLYQRHCARSSLSDSGDSSTQVTARTPTR